MGHCTEGRPAYVEFLRGIAGRSTWPLSGILAATSLLAGCATAGPDTRPSVGELHNAGVEYVLARLDSNLPADRSWSRISELTSDYCRGVRRACANQPAPPPPPDATTIAASLPGSAAYTESVKSLFIDLRAARTLVDFDRSLATHQERAAGRLRGAEAEQFANVLSVARSSSRLWAPISQGGRGGVIGGAVSARTNWWLVAAADANGCVAGGILGCISMAIRYSVAEYNRQQKSAA